MAAAGMNIEDLVRVALEAVLSDDGDAFIAGATRTRVEAWKAKRLAAALRQGLERMLQEACIEPDEWTPAGMDPFIGDGWSVS